MRQKLTSFFFFFFLLPSALSAVSFGEHALFVISWQLRTSRGSPLQPLMKLVWSIAERRLVWRAEAERTSRMMNDFFAPIELARVTELIERWEDWRADWMSDCENEHWMNRLSPDSTSFSRRFHARLVWKRRFDTFTPTLPFSKRICKLCGIGSSQETNNSNQGVFLQMWTFRLQNTQLESSHSTLTRCVINSLINYLNGSTNHHQRQLTFKAIAFRFLRHD